MWFLFSLEVIVKQEIRIKSKKEFDNIIKQGENIKNKYFILYYVQKKENQSRFGIAVGKKLGNAVVRNKIKRQLREIIKLSKNKFPKGKDYIIIIRKESLNLNFLEMKENLILLTEKVKNG